jgi:hypothetical protein
VPKVLTSTAPGSGDAGWTDEVDDLLDFESKERTGPWDETVFEDLRPIEVHRVQGVGAPDSEALTEAFYSWAFGSVSEESLSYVFHIPHDYKKGSRPVFHLHSTHNTASPTGDQVRWKTTWYYARGYSVDSFAQTGTVVSATQTPSAQFVHDIFGEDLLPCPLAFVNTLEPDGLVVVVLTREVGHIDDDFAQDIFVLTADLHYEVERHGTTERNRPFTSAGY